MNALILMLACTSKSPPITRVRAFVSEDAHTWRAADDIGAGGLSSLGLAVRPDGALWLSGVRPPTLRDRLLGPTVAGMIGQDDHWTPTRWSIDDPDAPAFIDPQWFEDTLYYMVSEGGPGDPMGPDRVNALRRGGGPDGARSVWEGQGVADPSPVRFQGQDYLFATAWPARVVQLGGAPLAVLQQWPAKTVPFALVVDGALWLLAQDNVNGRRHPVVSRSADGRQWSAWEPLIPWESAPSCTSPVMGPWQGGWILLCVDEGP